MVSSLSKEEIMHRKFIIPTLLVFILSGFITHGFAFDGKRQGFILGGGLGTGLTSFTQTVEFMGEEITSDRETKLPLVTSFIIGGGLSPNVLLYYINKVSFFSIENVFGNSVAIASGVGGLGVTYYFSPKAPSAFLASGLVAASWAAPFEEGTEWWFGPGILFGAGYEFSPHWSIGADVAFGWPSDEEFGIKATSNVFSLMVTFNGIAY